MALKFRKRNIILGIIAIEILALPVSAQMVNHVLFTTPADAAIVNLPTDDPTMSRLVIVSNTPFVLTAENGTGEAAISVHKSGAINDMRFGDKAQIPGAENGCAVLGGADASVIYTATQRTAVERGDVLDRSVIFEVRHAANETPTFNVLPVSKAKDLPVSAACGTTPA